MRNLKRALSLLLSSTMVLGMMVMGGSAAGYQDVDDSYNQEAIEVLQAVGIMTGDENGNFNPEKGVTRNEMAVIMSNLMAYNVATYSGTSPFTDVPSWAEPYVAACYTNGITSGTSATTYGGDETVTTAQAALMIMKALGYFQYSSDFGSDWQLATVSQGNKIDLFEKVNSGVKENMSRNDVAQLVLNGLKAGTVVAENNGSITVGDTTIVSGVKYNYVTSTQDYAGYIDESAISYDYAYVLSMGTDDDIYGNNVNSQTVFARLVLTDGTLVKVQTDLKAGKIGDYNNHIVSYTVDKNNVYTLSVRDKDNQTYKPDGTTIDDAGTIRGTNGIQNAHDDATLKIETGVANFRADSGDPAATLDNYTANSNTVFIVANSDADLDSYDFYAYTGIKNVPDIKGAFTDKNGNNSYDGAYVDIPAKMAVAADENGVAKVVYVEDADVSGAGNVIFARADSKAKLVRDSETGDYREIAAVVDGEVTTLHVKTESVAEQKLANAIAANGADMLALGNGTQWIVALESVTTNADGLVTNVRIFDGFNAADGDGYKTFIGTDKQQKEVIILGTQSGNQIGYGWYEKAPMVRYDAYKEEFYVSSMDSVKKDANDSALAVLDSNTMAGLCVVEYKNDDNTPAPGGEQSITNGDVTLTTTAPASALTVQMNSAGRINYSFNVSSPRAAGDIAAVNYTQTIYVNNIQQGAPKNYTGVAPVNGVVYGTANADIDAGDKVTVKITNVSTTLEPEQGETYTLTLKGAFTDAQVYGADGLLTGVKDESLGVVNSVTYKIDKANAAVRLADADLTNGNALMDANNKLLGVAQDDSITFTMSDDMTLKGDGTDFKTIAATIVAGDDVKVLKVTKSDGTEVALYTSDDGKTYYTTDATAEDIYVQTTNANAVIKTTTKDTDATVTEKADAAADVAKNTKDSTTAKLDTGASLTGTMYLYAASKVTQGSNVTLVGATDGSYVKVGEKLTATVSTPASNGSGVIASVSSAKVGANVANGYYVGNDDVTLEAAFKVTLENGVTAKVGTEEITATNNYVVNGQTVNATADLTQGTDIVKSDGKLFAAKADKWTDAAIASDLTLTMMTKLTFNDNVVATISYVDEASEIKVDSISLTTSQGEFYVVNGTTIEIVGDSQVVKITKTADGEAVEPIATSDATNWAKITVGIDGLTLANG